MLKEPMTPKGYRKLQERLKHLKAVERPKIVKAIEVARAHGDLSENAEYETAKEAQAQLEIEMRKVEDQLSRAEVIDPAKLNHAKVTFGATVTLENVGNGETIIYQIVGAVESDIKVGKVSVVSPIAKAMIGKEAGEVIEVHSPNGTREYEILKVEYR